jgi:hypothetical protein
MADPSGVIADADAHAAPSRRAAADSLDQTEFSEPAELHRCGLRGATAIKILSDSRIALVVVKAESESAALCVVYAAGGGFSRRAFVSPRPSSFYRQAYA